MQPFSSGCIHSQVSLRSPGGRDRLSIPAFHTQRCGHGSWGRNPGVQSTAPARSHLCALGCFVLSNQCSPVRCAAMAVAGTGPVIRPLVSGCSAEIHTEIPARFGLLAVVPSANSEWKPDPLHQNMLITLQTCLAKRCKKPGAVKVPAASGKGERTSEAVSRLWGCIGMALTLVLEAPAVCFGTVLVLGMDFT